MIVDAGDQAGHDPTQQDADQHAPAGHADELHHPCADREPPGQHGRQRQIEQDDRRPVVQQAFAFDQHLKSLRRAEPPDERHDGHWIGGGDEGPKEQPRGR